MAGYLYQFLDTVGDGSGSFLANVDGSANPVVFKIKTRDEDRRLILHRMIVFIEDTAAQFSAGVYGGLSSALANGIVGGIYKQADDSVVEQVSGGFAVKSNADWAALCFDAEPLTFGSGNEMFRVRWTFSKAGQPLVIQPDEYFGIIIQDDLTGLTKHTFMVQGMRDYYRSS